MRLLAVALVALLGLVQYPLWLGKGGWLRVWELDRQLAAQSVSNQRAAARNSALEGEVRDLREGTLAVEERARYELGMVRPDEVFVQIYPVDQKNNRVQPARPSEEPAVKAAKLDASQVRKAAFDVAQRAPAH